MTTQSHHTTTWSCDLILFQQCAAVPEKNTREIKISILKSHFVLYGAWHLHFPKKKICRFVSDADKHFHEFVLNQKWYLIDAGNLSVLQWLQENSALETISPLWQILARKWEFVTQSKSEWAVSLECLYISLRQTLSWLEVMKLGHDSSQTGKCALIFIG